MSESESDSDQGGELAIRLQSQHRGDGGGNPTVSLPLESLFHGRYGLGEEDLLVSHDRQSVGRVGPQLVFVVFGMTIFADVGLGEVLLLWQILLILED